MSDTPNNAKDWAEFLLSKELSSPFHAGKLAFKEIDEEDIPYAKLAIKLNADPVLSFYLMEAANKQGSNTTAYSKTLDHAMSMIGVDRVKKIIKMLPSKAYSTEEMPSLLYIKALVQSLYAAHLGRAIAQRKQQHTADDIYWSSLFLAVPVWYLWQFSTDKMCSIGYANKDAPTPNTADEQKVLHCSIQEICNALSQHLALPPVVAQCYQSEYRVTARQWVSLSRYTNAEGDTSAIEDRDLNLLCQQPFFIVQLANILANSAANSWYSKSTLRLQKVLAAFLKTPLSDSVTLTHEIAASMSRSHPIAGVLLPAAGLFLPSHERPEKLQEKHTPTLQNASNNEAIPTLTPTPKVDVKKEQTNELTLSSTIAEHEKFKPKPIFFELLETMRTHPEDYTDLHQLMNASIKALSHGLDLKRVTISLINKEKTRVKTYYSIGCDDHQQLDKFDAKLINGTIFSKLSERVSSVWIKPSSSEKVRNLVPMNFKQIIEVEDYFLMSIFVKDRPFAIIYSDGYQTNSQAKPQEQALTEEHYKYFKCLCKSTTQALESQIKNKQKPKA